MDALIFFEIYKLYCSYAWTFYFIYMNTTLYMNYIVWAYIVNFKWYLIRYSKYLNNIFYRN
jgi:hypothetical protein